MEVALYVPIIAALVQMLRQVFLPKNYASLTAVLLGVGYSFYVGGVNPDALTWGVVVGLSASGLYDVAKNPVRSALRRIR